MIGRKYSPLAFLLILFGCANMSYTPSIIKLGEYDDTYAIEKKAHEMSWNDAKDIKVFVGNLPKGVTITRREIKSLNNKVKIIGIVKANRNTPKVDLPYNFYDYPEDQDWRKGYCHWQIPLIWGTAFLWSLFVPLSYPCWIVEGSNSPKEIQARRKRIINTLKKMTKAAGGNTLIVTQLGKTVLFQKISHKISSEIEMTHGEGYALKIEQ